MSNPSPPIIRYEDECAHYAKLIIEKRIKSIERGSHIGLNDVSPMPHYPTPIPVDPEDPVCIVGAGVGGLYAAMMLQSLDIPYEILEASGCTGGRIFTYQFTGTDAHGEECKGHDEIFVSITYNITSAIITN